MIPEYNKLPGGWKTPSQTTILLVRPCSFCRDQNISSGDCLTRNGFLEGVVRPYWFYVHGWATRGLSPAQTKLKNWFGLGGSSNVDTSSRGKISTFSRKPLVPRTADGPAHLQMAWTNWVAGPLAPRTQACSDPKAPAVRQWVHYCEG